MINEEEQGTNSQQSEKPSASEIFSGKDVVIGRELVELLIADEVGVPVYYHNYQNLDKKINVMVDREVGNEDYSVRQKEENHDQLLGIIIPTADAKDQFIYIGIMEDDFVFQAGSDLQAEFNSESNVRYTFGWQRFGDRIAQHENDSTTPERYKLEILFKAHEDSQRFDTKVLEAVEKRRQIHEAIRKSRTEIRQNLKDKLFGGSS